MRTISVLLLLLSACNREATWSPETWGEDYIEAGIPSEDFADGCSSTFTRFRVGIAAAALIDADDQLAGDALAAPAVVDLVPEGPHPLGEATISADSYDHARFRIAPVAEAPALEVEGTLSCGEETIDFAWAFDTDTTYDCAPDPFTLRAGDAGRTQLTVHGDHLFYDHLESPDALVRGEAILAADADEDGVVTRAELAAVSVPALGYGVGRFSEATDLDAFIEVLTTTVGHVDGEGHCETTR